MAQHRGERTDTLVASSLLLTADLAPGIFLAGRAVSTAPTHLYKKSRSSLAPPACQLPGQTARCLLPHLLSTKLRACTGS